MCIHWKQLLANMNYVRWAIFDDVERKYFKSTFSERRKYYHKENEHIIGILIECIIPVSDAGHPFCSPRVRRHHYCALKRTLKKTTTLTALNNDNNKEINSSNADLPSSLQYSLWSISPPLALHTGCPRGCQRSPGNVSSTWSSVIIPIYVDAYNIHSTYLHTYLQTCIEHQLHHCH